MFSARPLPCRSLTHPLRCFFSEHELLREVKRRLSCSHGAAIPRNPDLPPPARGPTGAGAEQCLGTGRWEGREGRRGSLRCSLTKRMDTSCAGGRRLGLPFCRCKGQSFSEKQECKIPREARHTFYVSKEKCVHWFLSSIGWQWNLGTKQLRGFSYRSDSSGGAVLASYLRC